MGVLSESAGGLGGIVHGHRQDAQLSHAAKGSIDYLGAVLIVAACVPFAARADLRRTKIFLGLPTVLGLLAMFVVCTILFVIVEKRVKRPDHSHGAVQQQGVRRLGQYRGILFVDVLPERGGVPSPCSCSWGRACRRPPAGCRHWPLMLGLIAAATVSRAAGHPHRPGTSLSCCLAWPCCSLRTLLMSQMTYHTTRLDLGWAHGGSRYRAGPAAEPVWRRRQNGRADESNRRGNEWPISFFRQIGSTVGVAIFGTLLTNNLNTKLTAWALPRACRP